MQYVQMPHEVVVKIGEAAAKEKCTYLLPVYTALLLHANKKGKCFPSYERIKEVSGINSRSSISKALKILEQYGFIKKETRHGMHGNNTYYISKFQSPRRGLPKSTRRTSKVHDVDFQSPRDGQELYSFNYNHLTISHLTKGKNENEREKKENPNLPKSDLEIEREIKELFHSLSGRAMIPPEELILAKMLYNLPADEVIALIEDTYLKNPLEFPRKGLFLIPNWEAYQYG